MSEVTKNKSYAEAVQYTRKQRRNKKRGKRGGQRNKKVSNGEVKCFICKMLVKEDTTEFMGCLRKRDPKTGKIGKEMTTRKIYICKNPRTISEKTWYRNQMFDKYLNCMHVYKLVRLERNGFYHSRSQVDTFNKYMGYLKIINKKNYNIFGGMANNPIIIDIWDKEKKEKKKIPIHWKTWRDNFRKREGKDKETGEKIWWWGPPFNSGGLGPGKYQRYNTRNMIEVIKGVKKCQKDLKLAFKYRLPSKRMNCEQEREYLATSLYFDLYHELPGKPDVRDRIYKVGDILSFKNFDKFYEEYYKVNKFKVISLWDPDMKGQHQYFIQNVECEKTTYNYESDMIPYVELSD